MEIFQELGYDCYSGYNIKRDLHNPFYEDELESSLLNINSSESPDAVKIAIDKIKNIDTGSLEERNNEFTNYLQKGVEVNYLENEEEVSTLIKLIDFDNIDNNVFTAIQQWAVSDIEDKRPDIVVFINGIPLVVVELKSPSREDTDYSEGFTQIGNYKDKIPSLFVYNAFCVISDHETSKVGTITSDENRFMKWKTVDGDYANTQFAMFDVLFEGMFEKSRFLDILKNFICYMIDSSKYIKILAAYHQYFAVNKAISSTLTAIDKGDGKAGVFWHTQGSGKSLSMIFYVHKLQKLLDNPTFVIVTDRTDLDNQLFLQFSKTSEFLMQEPIQAESKEHLKKLLNNRKSNGIFFTTLQKFDNLDEPFSNRKDIIVISDEAHRSQYGLEENIDPETGEIKIGAARKVRNALPNATYIGFTGTPIFKEDKSTMAVFGDYIDIYDMTQAVEDGATVNICHEVRANKLSLDENILKEIDEEYERLAKNANPSHIEKSKKELSRLESILGSPEVIDSLCKDIINHYENYREAELNGKAMLVAYSRPIAMKIYKKILELRPEWKDKVNVVMTSSNKDPEEWHDIIGTKKDKIQLAKRFKDNDDPFKIAIVVDMWLTGFDVPSLDTMYIYKSMQAHNLMQSIARVNRVCEGKEGGLIVDYLGLSSALNKALNEYTSRDNKNFSNMNIDQAIYPKFQEELEFCQDTLHGFDYSKFSSDSKLTRSKTISGAVNFLEDPKRMNSKDLFLEHSLLLKKSFSLCKSIVSKEERFETAFFMAVRTILTRITKEGEFSLKEINYQINELLKQSIKSQGVINIFEDFGEEVSLFDSEFLERISSMKEDNIAISLLKKLLNNEIRIYEYSNIVKSEKFSEKLKKTMNSYSNSHITNKDVIKELISLANELKTAKNEGNELNLTNEELAFYDILTKPEVIRDLYKNDELINMTRELTEILRNSRTIDWNKSETKKAKLKVNVKKLLKEYNYPKTEWDGILDIIINQCNLADAIA